MGRQGAQLRTEESLYGVAMNLLSFLYLVFMMAA